MLSANIRKPSPRALQGHEAICEEFAAAQSTCRELGAKLDMRSLHTVHRHLTNLEARGFIEREPRKHRAIRPLKIGLGAREGAKKNRPQWIA